MKISSELHSQVAHRADRRCEYCLIHADDAAFAHEVDHVISRQHGGATTADNLAYACMICNRFKGTNLGSIDKDGRLVRLFNPRMDSWHDHFRLQGAIVEPISSVGEVTARLLRLNTVDRVIERSMLQRLTRYPRQ